MKSNNTKTAHDAANAPSRPPVSRSPTVTILRAQGLAMRKRFELDEAGQLKVIPYGLAKTFANEVRPAGSLNELAQIVETLSSEPRAILIRGAPASPVGNSDRTKELFPEPEQGCQWCMLDIDGVELPDGASAIDPASIELLVAKLPECFQVASYYYQFSSSAGVLKPDGTQLKAGISVHLFFWMDRPVRGEVLAAFLRLHCLETGFYERSLDRGGKPRIKMGIDESVLKGSVQAHYVAWPYIANGVCCTLVATDRQGLITKAQSEVTLPQFASDLTWVAARRLDQIRDAWRKECGFVVARYVTKMRNGPVGVSRIHYNPSASAGVSRGRQFLNSEVTQRPGRDGTQVQFARLFFVGESSPGSWYVVDKSPTIARRYGDGEALALKELSEGAYIHVRDVLGWFDDIDHRRVNLNDGGWLPPLAEHVEAAVTLLLAPTGSGKTTRVCEFARQAVADNKIVLYTAQTIALTRQMQADLIRARIPSTHYQDYYSGRLLMPGVYITTNESLRRFDKQLRAQGSNCVLVIDEAHAAIDDFMRSDTKLQTLEGLVGRSEKVLLMTGTITPLQIKKVTETVASARGAINSTVFRIVEFPPVKAFPLLWMDEDHFMTDVVALMRGHQALKDAGKRIPRTVLIVPTSRMQPFVELLAKFNLTDQAQVVSRDEATPTEIEAARTSRLPWLVTSPLFALGLNFECAPEILYTTFGQLQVDTSQIIQTLNRANRTPAPCEVRLYAGKLDPLPPVYRSEADERQWLKQILIEEGDVAGVIDPHFLVDRLTYLSLRDSQDRKTGKTLYQLQQDDGIQNYRIVPSGSHSRDEVQADHDMRLVAEVKRGARAKYDTDVAKHYAPLKGERTSILLHRLGSVETKRRRFNAPDVRPKDLNDESIGTLAALAGSDDQIRRNFPAKASVVKRLFAVLPPFLSSQYATERTDAGPIVSAQKTKDLLVIVALLQRLRDGEIDGISFGKKMRLKENRRGVLALVTHDMDYAKWQKRLEQLDALHEKATSVSAAKRAEQDKAFFRIAKEFLAGMGIEFDKTKGPDGRWHTDPGAPLVPDWDFKHIELALELQAESIIVPRVGDSAPVQEERWNGPMVALSTCQACTHCDLDGICILGRPNEAPWHIGIEPVEATCAAYVKLSNRLARLKACRHEVSEFPGDGMTKIPCQSTHSEGTSMPTTTEMIVIDSATAAQATHSQVMPLPRPMTPPALVELRDMRSQVIPLARG